jgi:hypothetical protein
MPDASESNPYTGDAPIDDTDGWGAPDPVSNNGSTPSDATSVARTRRQRRLFPATSFEEALYLGRAIQQYGSGQPIRRLTLFEALRRSPDSGPTRKLITASGQYGITKGAYNADVLSLTPLGATASDPTSAPGTQLAAKAHLAITGVAPFNAIYERYKDSRLPAPEVLRDAATDAEVNDDEADECVETFLANARDLGLVRNIGGSEHLIAIEAAVDEATAKSGGSRGLKTDKTLVDGAADAAKSGQSNSVTIIEGAPTRSEARGSLAAVTTSLDKTCFVISPIGDEGTDYRKHADLVLSSLIEPALKSLGLTAVRADKISIPGMITGQVIDHVARARLVIADLSFGNPNVYYELALRHAVRKPMVQLIRTADKLPFDVGQFRTYAIDMTDIYALVPQLDLHRSEISRLCRAAMEEGALSESPLSRFYPAYWSQIEPTGITTTSN